MKADEYYADHISLQQQRYEAMIDALDADQILVYSGAQRFVFQDDRTYPFRTNHHFKSWLPLTSHTNSFVLIEPGQRPVLIYHQPNDYWHVTPDAPQGFWVDHFDIRIIREPGEARQHLPKDLSHCAFLGEPTAELSGWNFGRINPPHLVDALDYDRAYKSAYEIECIAAANRIGARGHSAARDAFREGASELEIHLTYLKACGHSELDLPYENIIALNEHGAVLHYDVYDASLPAERNSFLIDAGASFRGYASDITRTYATSDGMFSELIDALDKEQRALAAGIHPGNCYVDLHAEMHGRIARILKDFDIVSMEPDTMVETNVTGYFFPHGLGHHIGLLVHDAGGKLASPDGTRIPQPERYPFLRNLREIEVGNVFTIEPGIYFIDLLLEQLKSSKHSKQVNWDRVDGLRPYGGIRIEDDVYISANKTRNLTREAFAQQSLVAV